MSTLDKLKELQAAATPGPWEVNPDGAEEWWYSDTILGEGGAGGALASCTKGNAPLVVTAINALPDLLELVEVAKNMQQWLMQEERISYDKLDAALAKLEGEV